MRVKPQLIRAVTQLKVILRKVDNKLLDAKLADDMFCLSANAQISLNFALRGYLPLVGTPIQLVDVGPTSQSQLLSKADEVIATLVHAAEIDYFDDSKFVNDDAGHKAISLPQSEYVLNFILPNLYFHISMVYAIARAHGVSVSKGDFDGIHYYPEYFSFV